MGLLATLLMISVTCHTVAGQPKKNNPVEINNLFFAYDFTIDKTPVKERVRFLDSIGYQGVTFPVNTVKDFEKLKDYQKFAKSETNNRLNIPAVFYHHNMMNKNAAEVWKKLADQLSGTKTDIWVIIGKGKDDSFKTEDVIQFLKEMADYCEPLHLNVVIYPHDKTYIESAAESLPYLKKANRKNLFTSFHLCHELRAGNGSRMNEAIAEVSKYFRLASISGSDIQMQADSLKGWDDAIKPLYKGDYDTSMFLEYLVRNGYKGPIALHTFGLKEPVEEHFSKSLETWNKMKAEVSKRLENSKR